jgi:hypothetical protein
MPIELCATTYAAAAFATLLLGWWGAIGVLALLAAASFAGSRLRRDRGGMRTAAHMTLLYAAVWPLMGASFWMTARAFVHVPLGDLPEYVGAFAAAWVVGLLAIYAPAGLGVREAVLVGILRSRIGSADALVIAAASRALFTLVDLLAAGVALRRRAEQGRRSGAEVVRANHAE